MRVFLYEYTSATNLTALRSEGRAMLTALLQDLAGVPGVELSTLIEESAADLLACAGRWPVRVETTTRDAEESAFRALAGKADGVVVIAPEFDDLLRRRCRWVEDVGGRLLGPSSEAVGLTSDKLLLATHWRDCEVNTPSTVLAGSAWAKWPAVLKPRYGAGSRATFLVRNEEGLAAGRARTDREHWPLILQPYVPGQPCSASFLIGPSGAVALPPGRQHVSRDGRFRYLGGSLPLGRAKAARAQSLARQAIEGIPGLRGYVGVDLILGAASDGSEDAAIEINPRLTTSYLGLRSLAQTNVAEVMLRVIEGAPAPELRWRPGPVHFDISEPEA